MIDARTPAATCSLSVGSTINLFIELLRVLDVDASGF